MLRRWMLVAALGGAGCSGMTMRTGAPMAPGTGDDGRFPGVIGGGGTGGPVNSTLPNGSSRRTVCRSDPYPRGWVAVDYVADGGVCGASSALAPYPAVLLQRLSVLPQGTVLIVCSGQSIPREWRRQPEETPSSTGQCPRNPGDTRTGATVMAIRREL